MADDTRERLIAATVKTLAEEGMGGTSARAIGQRASVNPALIYYHFHNLTGLLAETSRVVTQERAVAYRERLATVASLGELAVAARGLHEEERSSGNLAMLAQLLAGSQTHPEIAQVLDKNFRQLTSVVASAFDRILAGTLLDGILDSSQVAEAVSAGIVGIELLETVRGDGDDALFDTLDTVAALVDTMLSAGNLSTSLLTRRLRGLRGST